MNNKKGFSLVEVIVSAGAFVVFAMLIQSVLLLAHSFQLSQRNLLDTFQFNQIIKQKVCIANSFFKNRHINKDSSWTKLTVLPSGSESKGGGELETSVQDPITSTKYKSLASGAHSSADSQAILQLIGVNKVSQDSHTLVVLNSDFQTLQENQLDQNKSAKFLSGYIFASRCVKVDPSAIKTANGQKATFGSTNLDASAQKILDPNNDQYKYRPYYFPKSGHQAKEKIVRCCHDSDNSGTLDENPPKCLSAISEYMPRIYVIHFNPSDKEISSPTDSSAPPAFAGQVSAIQELPEWQDMDTIWGTGFMLSINLKQILSVSNFNLDIMVLKNTCATSLGHIKNCPTLSPTKKPTEQELIGLEGMNMGQFITADVSSCSGYSSGIDTTSAIVF